MTALLRAWCWLVRKAGGKHKWGRAYVLKSGAYVTTNSFSNHAATTVFPTVTSKVKSCVRCGTIVPVKRRVKKEAK